MTIDLARHYADKAVAVTGSHGYLGAALIEAIRPLAASVIPVNRPDANVSTAECWSQLVATADVIFHLAGNTSVSAARRDPDGSFAATVQPLIHLAEAARSAHRCPRVVFASTATVYGLTPTLPVDEATPAHPVTTYDRHKLDAEHHLAVATAHGMIDGVALRLANVYGPSPAVSRATERGVLNQAAARAVSGADLSLFGDGRYLRDYVYISDVVRAFLLAGAQPGLGGACNVASGTGTTVRDAFHLVAARSANATGRAIHIRETPWPDGTDPIECRQFTATIDRIAASCGWRPRVSLADGIDHLVAHLVNQ